MTTTAPLSGLAAATPLKRSIPGLTRPLSARALEAALCAFGRSYYIVHPFHRLMYEGELTRQALQGWVANRLAYQRVVPRKDAAIVSNCPDPEVRRVWLQRILDHDGTGPGTGGIEHWVRLGVAVGVPREEMEDERHVLPAVRLICESYVTFCKTKPWVEAVATSLSELFAPGVDQERIESLPHHYPWIASEELACVKSRPIQAPRDAKHALTIVQRYCTTVETQRRAFEALAFKIDLVWAMVDNIYHAYADA